MRKQYGFTAIELLVVISLIGIMSAVVMPNLLTWIPKYRLKSAVRDLYSNMQLAKMAAIKNSSTCTITYSGTPDTYTISGAMTATVNLADYGSGVKFEPAPGTGEFSVTSITFDSRGTIISDPIGYAYLSNAGGSSFYRVGALISGVIKLEQKVGGVWE